jgi:Skp family chaperone for outer membrane proteins
MIKSLQVLVTLLFVSTSMLMAQVAPKIAIVDMNLVLKDYYKTQEVEDRLKSVAEGYQKDLNDRRESYSKLMDQIRTLQEEARDTSLSDAKRKEKQDALQDKVKEARVREQENSNFVRTASGLMQDQRRNATEGIMGEIEKVVTSVAKSKGMNLVFAKAEFPSAVLYSDVTDLSADILRELNKNRPASAPAKK